jgi:long-chain acyl-CoA synthetase
MATATPIDRFYTSEQSDKDPIGKLHPDCDTLPKNFVLTARRLGDKIAMRKKRYGIWQEYTWAQSFQHVHDFCLGMVSMGLQHGDKVAIVGDNDLEYFWAELAAQSAGGVAIGIFTDATTRELEFILNNSDTVFLVAQDQEQVDRALELEMDNKIPNVRKIIYWDSKGLHNYVHNKLMSFGEVEMLGKAYAQQYPNKFEELVKQGNTQDVAILSYTSGTTSLPKGAMIRHYNLIYGSRHGTTLMPIREGDDYVSFSPLAWITEQNLGLSNHVIDGMVVNFPERAETVQEDIRNIAPVTLLFPSRIWEGLVGLVLARMSTAHWTNKLLFGLFLPIGYKIADLKDEKKPIPFHWKILGGIAELFLFASLRDKMGLSRMRYGYTSGAALNPKVLRFFRAMNVQLHQIYGSTECQMHTIHYPNDVRLGTVGKAPPTVEVKIDAEGEILIRSRSVFMGYYKAPDKTKEALTEDGWFRTGDAGYIDEQGHLIYLDRLTDLIELSGGEKFSPQYIEGSLKFSPYIQDAMTVGGFDMPYVTALVTVQFENVANWAERRGIPFTTLADLSQKPQVADLILKDIERTNQTLQPTARIRRYVVLPRTFDADEAELTRTRKLRRRFMEQKYGDILGAIYGKKSHLVVRSEVRYQDGRVGQTETDVRIWDVGDISDLPTIEAEVEELNLN